MLTMTTDTNKANNEVSSLVLATSLASIVTAIYLYTRGSKDAGIFVGLWAPTFLGLGSFFNATRAVTAAANAANAVTEK